MKLALLSDLHGNLQALEACLDHARRQGAEQYAFLGDLVGYGADPAAVVDRVIELAAAGALVLQGNHDAMVVQPDEHSVTLGAATAHWTRAQLTLAQLDFLGRLPLVHRQGAMLLVHATADDPAQWRYVYSGEVAAQSLAAARQLPRVRYVFGGHVHRQSLFCHGADDTPFECEPVCGEPLRLSARHHWLATIGSVGQPRDGDPRAMYALFDPDTALLTFQRIRYDVVGAAQAIRKAGLPEFFAERLQLGR